MYSKSNLNQLQLTGYACVVAFIAKLNKYVGSTAGSKVLVWADVYQS